MSMQLFIANEFAPTPKEFYEGAQVIASHGFIALRGLILDPSRDSELVLHDTDSRQSRLSMHNVLASVYFGDTDDGINFIENLTWTSRKTCMIENSDYFGPGSILELH